jgi:hypothetical protein
MIASTDSANRKPDDLISLTHVELIWHERQIEYWIRFGRVGFAAGSVFAFVRWRANDFGTVQSRIDILRAVATGQSYQTSPGVTPGGERLLHIGGWPKVERVLRTIDAIETLGLEPADIAPDHWRHVHNRVAVGDEPRLYNLAQHRAWRLRQRIGS